MNLQRLNWSIFKYFYNYFLGETPLNTHYKRITVPRYGHDSVSLKLCHENVFKDKFVQDFHFLLYFLLIKSYQAVRYSFFPGLTKSK